MMQIYTRISRYSGLINVMCLQSDIGACFDYHILARVIYLFLEVAFSSVYCNFIGLAWRIIWRTLPDLRDPSTTPLNFTKSINLALSERGINAMRQSERPKLLERVFGETIPMRGRMIHGKNASSELYEAPQDYDIHGRVFIFIRKLHPFTYRFFRLYSPSIGQGWTSTFWTSWNQCRTSSSSSITRWPVPISRRTKHGLSNMTNHPPIFVERK